MSAIAAPSWPAPLGNATVRQPCRAIAAEIYAVELIGDHTLVTVKSGRDMLTVKAAKDFAANNLEKVSISLAKERLFVFDSDTGARVR